MPEAGQSACQTSGISNGVKMQSELTLPRLKAGECQRSLIHGSGSCLRCFSRANHRHTGFIIATTAAQTAYATQRS